MEKTWLTSPRTACLIVHNKMPSSFYLEHLLEHLLLLLLCPSLAAAASASRDLRRLKVQKPMMSLRPPAPSPRLLASAAAAY